MNYVKLLSQNAFWTVNKHLAKYLKSNDAALLVAHFLSLQEEVFGGNPFYQQQQRVLDELNMKLPTLRKIVKQLQSENLLVVDKRGLPAKHYYYIDQQVLHKIVSLDLHKSAALDLTYSESQRKELNKNNSEENNLEEKEILYNNNITNIQREKNDAFRTKVDMNYINESLDSF